MERFKKWLALLVLAAGMVSASPMSVFAYTDEAAQEETAPETEAPVVIEEPVEETETETEATPFSVPGNGQLLDDKTDDDTKQFLTVQTKNGNTFFLVLDRSSHTENVYMLSMIDENDLAEFIEDTDIQGEKETETPQVVIPETEEKAVETEPEAEPEKQQANDRQAAGLIAGIVCVILVGGVVWYRHEQKKKVSIRRLPDTDDRK